MKKIVINLVFILICFFTFAQTQTVGVFQYDEMQTEDGYVLFSPNNNNTTFLIDNCGHLVHSWESNYPPGLSFYLLENGDLLRAAITNESYGFDIGGRGGRIERFNWEGDLIWEYEYANDLNMMHHDFKLMPNGNIIFIAWEKRSNAEAIQEGFSPFVAFGSTIWPDKIVEIEPNASGADVVWEWNLWHHLIQDYNSSSNNYGDIDAHPRKFNANTSGYGFFGGSDILHLNALDYNEDLDQIIMSSRNAQEIYVVDHSITTEEAETELGDFLWRWGNSSVYNESGNNTQTLFRQHDVHWIKDGLPNAGKIMVFNNGLDRPGPDYTSIEIIEPPLDGNGNYSFDTLNNQFLPSASFYTYDVPIELFNRYEGSSMYLPNGSLFINSGVLGHMIEVNTEEEIVWEYVSPVISTGLVEQGDPLPDGGLPNSFDNLMFRAYKYKYDYAGLEGKTIESQGALEINPLVETVDCTYKSPDYVSIEESSFSPKVKFHFNSENNLLFVESLEASKLKVYSITGKLMLNTYANKHIDVNQFEKALYFVEVEGNKQVFRFFKN